MIRIGTVKWFGGINRQTGRENDFGFISSEGEDVFFHRNGLACEPAKISDGRTVSFETETSSKGLRARKVAPIAEDSPKEILEACLTSPHVEYWRLAMPWLLQSRTPSEIADYLAARVKKTPSFSTESIFRIIPDRLFLESPELRSLVPIDLKVPLLSKLLLQVDDGRQKRDLLVSLVEAAEESEFRWQQVPTSLLCHQAVYEAAPLKLKLEFLISGYRLSEDAAVKASFRARIVAEFANVSGNLVQKYLHLLPGELKQEENIFGLLQPLEQAEICIEHGDLRQYWARLKQEAKFLVLFAAVKLSLPIPPEAAHDGDVVVSALARIGLAPKGERQKQFHLVHEAIQDHVLKRAWDGCEDLGLGQLLPSCRQGVVQYCEGRVWYQQGDDQSKPAPKAYCPRKNRGCQHDSIKNRYDNIFSVEEICDILI